jgi:uncharacterized membrane protein
VENRNRLRQYLHTHKHDHAIVEYSKHRFEFFSDGVMAIIMTIMVVEIPISDIFSFEEAGKFLESIIIFFISFFIVGWFWNKHHRLIDRVQKLNGNIVWKNLLFLFFVALLPLFTKLMILNSNNIITVISYDVVYLIANFCFFILTREVYHQVLRELPDELHKHAKKRAVPFIVYLRYIAHAVILVWLLAATILFPDFSMLLYIVFPIMFMLLLYLEKKFERL